MIYLVLGLAAVVLLWGRRKPWFKADGWRVAAAVLAVAAFTGAAFTGLRGEWGRAVVLVVLGLWTATSARRSAVRARAPAAAPGPGLAEARSILGVSASASRAEIQAAYGRLMRLAHPDTGGTTGLAAQLNAARDRLLRKG